jgi:hypothetical protein
MSRKQTLVTPTNYGCFFPLKILFQTLIKTQQVKVRFLPVPANPVLSLVRARQKSARYQPQPRAWGASQKSAHFQPQPRARRARQKYSSHPNPALGQVGPVPLPISLVLGAFYRVCNYLMFTRHMGFTWRGRSCTPILTCARRPSACWAQLALNKDDINAHPLQCRSGFLQKFIC